MKLDTFDLNGREDLSREALRKQWGFDSADSVLIGGSTHAGEEEILFRALARLRKENLALKLLVAPRHTERAGKILELARRHGLKAILASAQFPTHPFSPIGGEGKTEGFDILILDVLGELRKIYPLADCVFMGGSLIRHGGQNPIEPAFSQRPIIHGPWVFNFQEIYERLDREGGSLQVKNEEELIFVLKRVLASDHERQHLGNRAFEILKGLRGATERNFAQINPLITVIAPQGPPQPSKIKIMEGVAGNPASTFDRASQ